MKSLRSSALAKTLFSSESSWTPKTQPLVKILVFNSTFGRHSHWLRPREEEDCHLLQYWLVVISACVCRRPSWTPKTQPNGSSVVVWLRFWCSTRFSRKSVSANAETHVRLHFYIFDYVVFEQPLKPKRLFSAKIPYLYIWSSWTSTGNPTWSVGSNTNRLLISTDWCHNIKLLWNRCCLH